MKTYSSVEEMRQEYARIKARLLMPKNAIKDLAVPKLIEPKPEPVIWSVDVIKLEHKPEVHKTKIWWHEIVEAVEEECGISAFDFMSVRRSKHLLPPRLLVYALASDCCPHLSLLAIGRLAHKDHSTILKGAIKGRQHPSYQKLKTALLSRLSPPSGDPELGETGRG